jgi:two-component system, OmpR family, heavy metal sensor histidine kinase CusS
MKPLSLRIKIALLSALISGFVLLGFGTASWYLLYQQKVQGVDTEIRSLGTRHPGWLANRANFDRLTASLDFIFGDEHRGKVIVLVKDPQGQTLYASPGWPKSLIPDSIDCSLEDEPKNQPTSDLDATTVPQGPGAGPGRGGGRGFGPGRGGGPVVFNKIPRFFAAKTPDSTWRLGIMGNDDLRLVVGLNYADAQAELNRIRNIYLLAVPLALLLVGGGGWLVAGRALRPLKRIASMAEQVTARGLDQRIPISDEDPEIRRLVHMLNGMMNRLEASFRQATRFSADASHELKTPLAVMQGELENAIQGSTPGSSVQRVFCNLLEETQQLKRITGSLLLLAQADSGQLKLTPEEIPLSEDIEAMIEDAQIMAADSNIKFMLEVQPGIKIQGDRGLLRMALLNLIQNAVRYNEPDGRVGLTLVSGTDVVLTLCNTGPGIPPADQPRIFDRFYRGRSTGPGSGDGLGLGLSLAREIILAHKGSLQLKESRPGHTCFTVSLKQDQSS